MLERVCIELRLVVNAQNVCKTLLRVLTIGKLETDTARGLQLQQKKNSSLKCEATLPILLANGRAH
jgi:hypothetical protein